MSKYLKRHFIKDDMCVANKHITNKCYQTLNKCKLKFESDTPIHILNGYMTVYVCQNLKVEFYYMQLILKKSDLKTGSIIKNPPVNAGDASPIAELGRFPEEEKWQPTSLFSPGKFHGQRSLAGYSPWGRKSIGYNLASKQQQKFKNLDIHWYDT